MISDTGCDYLREDKQLEVGKKVKAYWCRNGFYYQGEGVIVQLAHDNVAVQLQEAVAWSDDFTPGKTIRLPRITNGINWSTRNCVRPLKKQTVAV